MLEALHRRAKRQQELKNKFMELYKRSARLVPVLLSQLTLPTDNLRLLCRKLQDALQGGHLCFRVKGYRKDALCINSSTHYCQYCKFQFLSRDKILVVTMWHRNREEVKRRAAELQRRIEAREKQAHALRCEQLQKKRKKGSAAAAADKTNSASSSVTSKHLRCLCFTQQQQPQ